MILEEKSKIFTISLQYKTLIFLNQGQGSVFTLRECAQSITRLEKPKNRRFSHKNPKMFDFRFNTPTPSLNQGQGSILNFRRCAQSISRMILPLKIQRFCHTTVFLKSTVFFKHPVLNCRAYPSLFLNKSIKLQKA